MLERVTYRHMLSSESPHLMRHSEDDHIDASYRTACRPGSNIRFWKAITKEYKKNLKKWPASSDLDRLTDFMNGPIFQGHVYHIRCCLPEVTDCNSCLLDCSQNPIPHCSLPTGIAGLTDFVVVVFTILNSLQGLFIFLIWIVFHPTNLKQSRKLLHKKAVRVMTDLTLISVSTKPTRMM